MKRKTKLARWMGTASARGDQRVGPVASVLPAIRPKRPNRTLLGWSQKLYVPVPTELKCEVQRVCRERHMTQAELGLLIVQGAFGDPAWLASILDAARDAEPPERA